MIEMNLDNMYLDRKQASIPLNK